MKYLIWIIIIISSTYCIYYQSLSFYFTNFNRDTNSNNFRTFFGDLLPQILSLILLSIVLVYCVKKLIVKK